VSLDTRIGKLEFTHKYPGGYPTKETVEKLYDERDFQRAVQAYLWAMPAVSFWGAKRVLMEPKGAAYGDFTPFTTFAALSHFLTPNVTTPYTLSWFNLAETGPFVVEIPPGPIAGFVDDLWQRPVTDMGQPGPDKGKGGKFLVLGPEHSAPADAKDYITVKIADQQQPPADPACSATSGSGRKFPRTRRDSRRTRTGRWTCTSVRRPPLTRKRTGYRRRRTSSGSPTSASTRRPKPTSTGAGRCRTSNW
jgi:hypothetical protein